MSSFTAIIYTNMHTISVQRFYAKDRKTAFKKLFNEFSGRVRNIKKIDLKSDNEKESFHQRFTALFTFSQKVHI